jgi:hypothetical protein
MSSSRIALMFALLTVVAAATASAQDHHVGAWANVEDCGASEPAPAPDANGHVGAWVNIDDVLPDSRTPENAPPAPAPAPDRRPVSR